MNQPGSANPLRAGALQIQDDPNSSSTGNIPFYGRTQDWQSPTAPLIDQGHRSSTSLNLDYSTLMNIGLIGICCFCPDLFVSK